MELETQTNAELDSGGTEEVVETDLETSSSEEPTEATDTTEQTDSDGDKGESTDSTDSKPDIDLQAKVDNLHRQIRATTSERASLKARIAELEAQKQPTPPKQPEPTFDTEVVDAGKVNKELSGLQYDPTDKTVLIDPDTDRWVSPREALAVIRSERYVQMQETAARAEIEQKIASIRTDTAKSLMADLNAHVSDLIADQDEDFSSVLRMAAAETVTSYLTEKGVDLEDPMKYPDNIGELAQQAMKPARERLIRIIAGAQGKQIAANTDAKAKQPVATGGRAGIPGGKTVDQMTPDEFDAYTRSLMDRAKAKTGYVEDDE